ncbi:hypothetical protein HMN09_00785600 [Mycena chlorophos]|uniref:Uncharacterized protein n=1 Tax=Mycena chlorophos TaxID=658473 RepID=A0A8H6SVY6_MYCCL|nr:hypothetical protein HMN09_00785600 [Mycena chlorophos]
MDTCNDINNCRLLFDVVWGCLATVFACVWVSVHPNVPPRSPRPVHGSRTTRWTRFRVKFLSTFIPLWHRFKLMLIALVAPELIAGFAGRQLAVARSFSKEFDVSLPHAFLIGMGGFSTPDGHPIVTRAQIREPGCLEAIREVSDEDVEDKSKGDFFSKGVALLQGLWFVAQCIARAMQRLPLAEIETATLAFAVINIFVWILWWNKPLDVAVPIVVGPIPADPIQSSAKRRERPAYRTSRWTASFFHLIGGQIPTNRFFDPRIEFAVPMTWHTTALDAGDIGRGLDAAFLGELLGGAVFGGIHCSAWYSHFPTVVEMWMWRVAALTVTAAPLLLALGILLENIVSGLGFVPLLMIPLTGVYILARLVLMVLPFTSLRSLSPGVFIDIDWSVYIPHF